MKNVEWRYAYDGYGDEVTKATGLACDPETDKTQQASALDCDINEIVRRYGISGRLPQPRELAGYGDFTGVDDYQSALNQMIASQRAFDALPAKVRERFGNDPAQLYEFVHRDDDDSRAEAIKLGLVKAPEAPPGPMKVEVVNPPTAEGEKPV